MDLLDFDGGQLYFDEPICSEARVAIDTAARIVHSLPPFVTTVPLFVDATTAQIAEPWRRYRRLGNSLFVWRFGFFVACLAAFGGVLVIALVAGYIINAIPFFLLAILAGPVVGGFIAQMVLRFTGKRRGRYTGYVVVAGILAGILPSQAYLIELLFLGLPIGIALQGLLWPGLFAILTASVAFGWFRYGPRI